MGNKPLRLDLNDEGSHWISFSTYAQLWSRVTQNNPGSLVYGEAEDVTTDLSIRRFRAGLNAKPVDKLYISLLLGINNLNYLSPRGTAVDLLDAYAEYNFSEAFSLGGGKSSWDGLSRYSSPSSSSNMSYDLVFLALPTLDASDDLIRKLSIYAKGKLGKLDYRMILAKPLLFQNSRSFDPQPVDGVALFTDAVQQPELSGYFKYEFWEKESNRSAYHTSSYQGKKKILNLGAGFLTQQDALWSLDQGDTVFHDMVLLATDIFMDIPLGKGKALTYYLGYFNYDFGPNYIRLLGANNPTNGLDPQEATFNGRGNSFPVSGTGNSILTQAGFAFPEMGNAGRLQPYFTLQYSDFELLSDPMIFYDIGLNWFINDHMSKFTLNLQNRPIFDNEGEGLEVTDRKLMMVLQYQFRVQ